MNDERPPPPPRVERTELSEKLKYLRYVNHTRKMADTLQIDAITKGPSRAPTYKGIDWLWSQDLQGGGYGGITQLQYDTQSVSNSGQFIVWSQAFLYVPYTITMTNVGANTAGAVTWKAGFWNLIESLQISCQNKTVNNLCNKTNMAQTCRVILNADYDKITTSLPTYGFTLDTAETATVSGTGSAATLVPQNNRILGVGSNNPPSCSGAYSNLFPTTNQGLIQRAKNLNFQPDGNTLSSNNSQLVTAQRNFSSFAGTTQTVTGIAVIPLKYLSDFFSEENLGCPLHNLRMYIQANFNQGSFTYTAATNAVTNSTFPFQTIPIIVTDAGNSAMTSATSVVTLSIGQYNGSTFPTRLYYPTVQLEASTLARMTFPLKKMVTYRDIQYFTLTSQAAGNNINWQVSNAIPGLKRVFILPLIAAANQLGGKPSWAQAVSSVPGTGDPNVNLQNVSLQINTRQVWSNNILYSSEMFIEQILPNRLNGDTCEFVAGSSLSEYQWLTSYGWYVFDCSKVPSLLNVTANTPVNLQLLATNNSAVPIDLFCWAEVETDVVLESTPMSTYVQ